VLHAVPELPEHDIGKVDRILGDKVNANALGADQAHHLLDFVDKRFRGILEEQVGFVEEEDELRFVEIADLGELLEHLREEIEQEHGVERGIEQQLFRGDDVDHATPVIGGAHEIGKLKRWLAEQHFRAALLQPQQLALDGADALGGDGAVLGCQVLPVVTNVLQRCTQILEIEQQQPEIVGVAKHEIEHTGLRVVER